jgi:microcystin-dependent protein
MTWNGISDYSATPGSNSAINGINIAEGCNASGINDAIRQLMADIATSLAAGTIGIQPGYIIWVEEATAPTGFQALDGSAVSRTTYPALFTLLGTTYGSGDGSTTFNLPDWRGRTPVGYDAGNATSRMTGDATGGIDASTVGNTGGEQAHAQTSTEMASHTHTATTTVSVSKPTGTLTPCPSVCFRALAGAAVTISRPATLA